MQPARACVSQECIDCRMDGCDGWRMDGCDGWMDGWMEDGWMDGWDGGWMKDSTILASNITITTSTN